LIANFIALLRDCAVICDYCNSQMAEGEMKCSNCGAPIVVDATSAPDFRHCPVCHRRLLALGSPACSYCGRRLPPDYIKARESDLQRVAGLRENSGGSELVSKVDELIRENARKNSGHSSFFGLFDITTLTDFFD